MKEVVNKAYKFRIYPTDEQKVFFAKHFGCTRFIYNYFKQIGLEAPELTPVEKSAAVFSIIPYASAKAHCTGQTQKIQAASAKQELKASS